jgi:hypothetical protein
MESLKMINEISDETFNDFLSRLSFNSKRFLCKVQAAFKEKGIVLTTKDMKQSFISFLDYENTKDFLIVFLKENEDRYSENILSFMKELERIFFYYPAFVQTNIPNKAVRGEMLETYYKTIESALIQLGETYSSTNHTIKVKKQLLSLINANVTPARVLQLKECISVFFVQDMIGKLAQAAYISDEYKNELHQVNWIYRAFNVEFYIDNQQNHFQCKINWNNLNHLSDWLLFLKNSCIVYDYKNNKQLLDWVIEHVTYKKQEFSKGSTTYKSLIRSIKLRKDYIDFHFTMDNNKLFKMR